MIHRRRPVFRREAAGVIEVNLPPAVSDVLVRAAEQLQATVEVPRSPGFARLFARVDESTADEDPAITLSRQMLLDRVASTVIGSAGKRMITDDEADAWLKVLGMTLARHAAELHVTTDADRASLSKEDGAMIDLIQALQVSLMIVLDTEAPVNR